MPKRTLPATDPRAYKHWTFLAEETRQELEHFRDQGDLPPNYKPSTLQRIAVVEKYWRIYCFHLEVDYKEHLLLEESAVYMCFFDWMWKKSIVEVKKKRLQSYDEYWRGLNQYFNLFTRRPMSNHVLQQMRRFLNDKYPRERGISRRAKSKTTLSPEEYGLIQRYWWKFSFCFRHGNMIVQESTLMLWSSITGTRPGTILPPNSHKDTDSETGGTRKRSRQDLTFLSDLPQYSPVDDLPKTVCYEDIELFYLRNPGGSRDVLCAIITFRNLKGRPEGADG
jgi:Protein of unknown function (DUF3435)